MDLVQILKEHHRGIEKELNELATRPGLDRMDLQNLCQEIEIHLAMAKNIIYPETQQILEAGEFSHLEQEAKEIESLVQKLKHDDRPSINPDLKQLQLLIQQHFKGIQLHLFPAIQAQLSPDQTERLAKRLEQERLKALQETIKGGQTIRSGKNQ